MLFLLSLTLIIQYARAQCADCDAVSSLLSSCSLLPLNADWYAIEKAQGGTVYRNLSGIPNQDPFNNGPATAQLANYSQASCFCIEVIKHLNTCLGCIVYGDAPRPDPDNELEGSSAYFLDCTEFGYFANDTLAYPSTTRTSMPVTTSTAETGCEVYGVIEGQLDECGLVGLDKGDEVSNGGSTTIYSEIDNSDYYTHVLFNRTAGECFCTLPVLRRLKACRYCV